MLLGQPRPVYPTLCRIPQSMNRTKLPGIFLAVSKILSTGWLVSRAMISSTLRYLLLTSSLLISFTDIFANTVVKPPNKKGKQIKIYRHYLTFFHMVFPRSQGLTLLLPQCQLRVLALPASWRGPALPTGSGGRAFCRISSAYKPYRLHKSK